MNISMSRHTVMLLTAAVLITGHADAYWKMVWSDEFDGASNTKVDASKWTYCTWNPGTVNQELQKYTNRLENVFQDGDGNLVIKGLRDNWSGYTYTSGRIETQGRFSFKYGRVECRAKLPAGGGSWPAIWMLGTNGNWPTCGEIDIMEQAGSSKNIVHADSHTNPNQTSTELGNINQMSYTFPNATTASTDYHVYSLDWYADSFSIAVDGNTYAHTTLGMSSPFRNNSFYIILNVAIGGMMGGTVDNENGFPMTMVVDYVRVYEYSSTPTRLVSDDRVISAPVSQSVQVSGVQLFDLTGRRLKGAMETRNGNSNRLVIVGGTSEFVKPYVRFQR